MSWTARLPTLGTFRPEGVPWSDLWVLLLRGENHKGLPWLQSLLWDFKYASWIASLAQHGACQTCGGALGSNPHALSRYCSTACRKVAHRRRKAEEPTEFEAMVTEARATLRRVDGEIADAHRWIRRHRKLKADQVLLPPDLARLDHLPYLPGRCGVGCGTGACGHTDGGLCVFARTGGGATEE